MRDGAKELSHLQCPVTYLSRLQRIQPTARELVVHATYVFKSFALAVWNLAAASEPKSMKEKCGGGTNPCDMGLDLSGSWQQGHSATYNAPSRI